jgi:hypothetical protein
MTTLQEIADANGVSLSDPAGLRYAQMVLEELSCYGGSFPKPYEIADELREGSADVV